MPRLHRTRGSTGHSRRACLTVLVLASLVGAEAPAQTRTLFNSDQIPRDLVIALLAEDGSVPDILIGKAPDLLAPKLVLPHGARILGTRLSSSQTTVIVDVPMKADSLRLQLDSALRQRGWVSEPAIYAGGGFQPANMRTPSAYCADGQSLRFALLPQGRGTLVRYTVAEDEHRCVPTSVRTESGFALFSMPVLIDPQGTDRKLPSCRSIISNGYTSGTSDVLHTTQSPEELLAAYGKQLADSGWMVEVRAPGDRTVESHWYHKPTGTRVDTRVSRVSLSVTQPAAHPDCRVLHLESGFDTLR
jgi:hypothetical protein